MISSSLNMEDDIHDDSGMLPIIENDNQDGVVLHIVDNGRDEEDNDNNDNAILLKKMDSSKERDNDDGDDRDDNLKSSFSQVDLDGNEEIDMMVLEKDVESKLANYMLLSHFITRMGDRMWEFIVPLVLIYITPSSLVPTALYGLATTLIRIVCGASVGDMIDKNRKLIVIRVGIFGQMGSVSVTGVALYCLLRLKDKVTEPNPIDSDLFYSPDSTILFLVLLLFGALHSLSGQIMNISVERKWLPAVVKRDVVLTKVNSQMRQVDLATEVLAPFIAGILSTPEIMGPVHIRNLSVQALSFVIILIFNFLTFWPQYFLLARVRAICKEKSFEIDNVPEKPEETEDIDTYLANYEKPVKQKVPLNERLDQIKKVIMGQWNPLTNIIKGWRIFLDQKQARLIIIAYVCLWFTLLSPHDPVLTAYLSGHGGYNNLDLSLFRGIGAVFGLASTFTFTWFVSKIGLENSSIAYLMEQAIMVLATGITFSFIQSNSWMKYQFLVFIVLSRCGLYGFEICEINFVQKYVPDEIRGIVSGVESSLTSLSMLIVFLTSIIINSPQYFSILIWLSVGFIQLGFFILLIWRFKK
ncbi:hypothetical protein DLAC_00819 [Tieghemostelium lacteum]|uniref:Solute carrier family 40 member n=1 Tax=Tieghemostelium lacteum TaxID=361077 RepID=A0A152A747_TIELA|nr:hypothetical protein DLAC_00819 [Tieghemostelium lacteum]|eukprot:KYR02024.1 hypothetical protein DLAC_00819 [Tieghemostelium lacteum]